MRAYLRDGWDLLFKGCMAALGALAGRSGAPSGALPLLLLAMAGDLTAGLLLAVRGQSARTPDGGMSLRVFLTGLTQKVLTLLVVALSGMLDRLLSGGGAMFSQAAALFYLSHEGLSLVENMARLGIPMPKRLKTALMAFRDADAAHTPDRSKAGM